MPTYDYECGNCGHTFDEFQSMSDDPLKKCPKCGKQSLKRLIGGGLGVIFKGSGFYSTDTRSSSSSSSDSTGKSSGTKSSGSDTSSKSDSGKKDSGKDSSSSKTEKVAG